MRFLIVRTTTIQVTMPGEYPAYNNILGCSDAISRDEIQSKIALLNETDEEGVSWELLIPDGECDDTL